MKKTFQPLKLSSLKGRKSLIHRLKSQGRLSPEFEAGLHRFSLEELIAMKLEATCRAGKLPVMLGVPVFRMFHTLCRAAVFRWAMSIAKNDEEAAQILGIDMNQYWRYQRRYYIRETFFPEVREDESDHEEIP